MGGERAGEEGAPAPARERAHAFPISSAGAPHFPSLPIHPRRPVLAHSPKPAVSRTAAKRAVRRMVFGVGRDRKRVKKTV